MKPQPLKFYDVEQNSDEWIDLRIGKITSSSLGKIMANYGKAFGDPAKRYASNIVVEQMTGKPISSGYSNDDMERGHEQEPLARAAYEEIFYSKILNGGFFDCGYMGCSPDGLIGENGLIEIKSVIASVHCSNVKRQSYDPAYKWQFIGNLKLTGKEWIDYVSYCADFPKDKQIFCVRLYAEQFQEEFEMIDLRIDQFLNYIDEERDKILNSQYAIGA